MGAVGAADPRGVAGWTTHPTRDFLGAPSIIEKSPACCVRLQGRVSSPVPRREILHLAALFGRVNHLDRRAGSVTPTCLA
jgi:hypothetical protein